MPLRLSHASWKVGTSQGRIDSPASLTTGGLSVFAPERFEDQPDFIYRDWGIASAPPGFAGGRGTCFVRLFRGNVTLPNY